MRDFFSCVCVFFFPYWVLATGKYGLSVSTGIWKNGNIRPLFIHYCRAWENSQITHRLSRKFDSQIASCFLYFSKTKWVLMFQKSEVDKKQLMEGPYWIWVNYFYCRNTRERLRDESMCPEACPHLHMFLGLHCQRGQHSGNWLEIPPHLLSAMVTCVQMQISSWAHTVNNIWVKDIYQPFGKLGVLPNFVRNANQLLESFSGFPKGLWIYFDKVKNSVLYPQHLKN